MLGHVLILIGTLVKEEVGGKLLILVAREVGLDSLVLREAKASETLNSIALLLCNGNTDGTTLATLAEEVKELIGVLCDHLGELRVTSSELLQDRLQHLGLFLYELTHLLELGVVTEEIEVAETSSLSTSSLSTTTGTTSTSAVADLGSKIEKVDLVVIVTAGSSGGSGLGGGGSSSGSTSRSGRRLTRGSLLLEVGRNTLQLCQYTGYTKGSWRLCETYSQEVLNGALGVIVSRTHSSIDLGALETHSLHVGDGLGALLAHRKSVSIASTGSGGSLRSRSGSSGRWRRGGGSSSTGGRSSGRSSGCRGRSGGSSGGGRGGSGRRLGGLGGSGLGLRKCQFGPSYWGMNDRTLFTTQTTNPFSSIL